jgi:hypothetical protein
LYDSHSVPELAIYLGTTLLIGDTQDVEFFYENVPGAKDASSAIGPGFFTVPCDAVPTLSLGFAGTTFSVSPDIFNLGQLFEGSADCVGGFMGEDLGQCPLDSIEFVAYFTRRLLGHWRRLPQGKSSSFWVYWKRS